jgi:hypothetical protein
MMGYGLPHSRTTMAKPKTLLELDPVLHAQRNEYKIGIAVHYFCNECDYHERRYFEVPHSIADNITRPIAVPHSLHWKDEG